MPAALQDGEVAEARGGAVARDHQRGVDKVGRRAVPRDRPPLGEGGRPHRCDLKLAAGGRLGGGGPVPAAFLPRKNLRDRLVLVSVLVLLRDGRLLLDGGQRGEVHGCADGGDALGKVTWSITPLGMISTMCRSQSLSGLKIQSSKFCSKLKVDLTCFLTL